MTPPRALATPIGRSARLVRAASAAVVVAGLLVGGVSAADPADAAATPYMTYEGASVNSANVPATTVEIGTRTGVKFDRGTYYVNGVERGDLGDVTFAESSGYYTGTGTVDLTGFIGSVKVVAKIYSGKYMVQSITKYLRAVPVVTSGIPEGFPTAATTGVPAGTKLTPSTDLAIWEAGAVLDGLDIQGCLSVNAPNVVVRNSRISCDDPTLRAVSLTGAPGFVMEDSEIVSDGSAEVAIGWSGYTLRRVDIHGAQDGPRLGSDVTIVDSYIHDLVRDPDVHTDAMQSTSGTNILVRHNTLDPRQQGSEDYLNSAVQLGTETGSQKLADALFEGNFFNGGAYSVNVSCTANVEDVTFRKNRYGHGNRYGAAISIPGVTFTDERWVDTGNEVKVAAAC